MTGSIPLTFQLNVLFYSFCRQGWGARIDLHDSHFLAIAAAEQELLNAQYEEYAAAHNSGIACCRSVALIVCLNVFLSQRWSLFPHYGGLKYNPWFCIVDAASACSPCTHGYKGCWNGPRRIRLLQRKLVLHFLVLVIHVSELFFKSSP